MNKYQKIIRDGEEIQQGSIDTHAKFDQITEGINFKGKKVVDIGCNCGEMCRLAKDLGATVIGIDRTPDFIKSARELNPDIDFHIGTDKIINGDNDIVIASAMFHYVKEHDLFFKQISKCTKLLIMDVWLSDETDNAFHRSKRGLYIPTKSAYLELVGKYFNKIDYKGVSISPDKSKRYIYHLSEPKPCKSEALLIYGVANTGKSTLGHEYETLGYEYLGLDLVFMAFYNKFNKIIKMNFSVSNFVIAVAPHIKKEYHLFHRAYVRRWLRDKVGHNVVIEGYDMINEDYRKLIIKELDNWTIKEIELTKIYEKT